MDQDTPDINFSEDPNDAETPDINFTELEEHETADIHFDEITDETIEKQRFETEDDDIDDLDEPDQYVEGDDIGGIDESVNNSKSNEENKNADKSKQPQSNRMLNLPSARVKHIMKADPDVTLVTGECTFLVAKATELFIESLAREAFLHTAQAKKKTVQKRDVDAAIENVDALMFLDGMMNG